MRLHDCDERYDAQGKLVFPGFIDPHVHSREPGLSHKEDFDHSTRGALVGGTTDPLIRALAGPATAVARLARRVTVTADPELDEQWPEHAPARVVVHAGAMDVVWLESLLALVEHGSFTRAAEELHVSQSAFSRRIRALEQWVGADLIDRDTYPVTLTRAGVALRAQAVSVVAGLAAVRDEVRGRQMMPVDAVRLSISHTLATHFFPRWWREVTDGDQRINCRLSAANTLDGYDDLLHGGCDLLLAYADPARPLGIDHGEVESVVVAHDRFAPYSRARDGRPELTLPGSADRPVPCVSHGTGAFLGRVTDRLLAARRPHLRPVIQCDLSSVLAELVLAGAGVGWLPGLLIESALAAGSVVQVGDPLWCTTLEIRLWRPRKRRTSRWAAHVWEHATSQQHTADQQHTAGRRRQRAAR